MFSISNNYPSDQTDIYNYQCFNRDIEFILNECTGISIKIKNINIYSINNFLNKIDCYYFENNEKICDIKIYGNLMNDYIQWKENNQEKNQENKLIIIDSKKNNECIKIGYNQFKNEMMSIDIKTIDHSSIKINDNEEIFISYTFESNEKLYNIECCFNTKVFYFLVDHMNYLSENILNNKNVLDSFYNLCVLLNYDFDWEYNERYLTEAENVIKDYIKMLYTDEYEENYDNIFNEFYEIYLFVDELRLISFIEYYIECFEYNTKDLICLVCFHIIYAICKQKNIITDELNEKIEKYLYPKIGLWNLN